MINIYDIRDYVKAKTKVDIESGRRSRHIVSVRAIYFKLCRQFTITSLKDIGQAVGRDHATVIHGLKLFDEGVLEPKYYVKFESLLRNLSEIQEDSESKEIIMWPRNDIIDYYEDRISKIHMEYLSKLEEKEREINRNIENKGILSVCNELSRLSDGDIHIFIETRLKPFISMRQYERVD